MADLTKPSSLSETKLSLAARREQWEMRMNQSLPYSDLEQYATGAWKKTRSYSKYQAICDMLPLYTSPSTQEMRVLPSASPELKAKSPTEVLKYFRDGAATLFGFHLLTMLTELLPIAPDWKVPFMETIHLLQSFFGCRLLTSGPPNKTRLIVDFPRLVNNESTLTHIFLTTYNEVVRGELEEHILNCSPMALHFLSNDEELQRLHLNELWQTLVSMVKTAQENELDKIGDRLLQVKTIIWFHLSRATVWAQIALAIPEYSYYAFGTILSTVFDWTPASGHGFALEQVNESPKMLEEVQKLTGEDQQHMIGNRQIEILMSQLKTLSPAQYYASRFLLLYSVRVGTENPQIEQDVLASTVAMQQAAGVSDMGVSIGGSYGPKQLINILIGIMDQAFENGDDVMKMMGLDVVSDDVSLDDEAARLFKGL